MDETELFALIESMRAVGQLQPIIVKPSNGKYEVVAGHRRLRAAIYLRWHTINSTIMEGKTDDFDAAKCHENAFRESINPEDEGRYFQYLATSKKWGTKEIAHFANRSHYYVESRLACLTWPVDIRDALRQDIIGLGAAEALAEISENAERIRLLSHASTSGVSAKTARAWADAWLVTKQSIDVEAMHAAQQQIAQKWEEPMFPCYGCERPVNVSQLHTIRLCGGCHAELESTCKQTANTRRTDPTPGMAGSHADPVRYETPGGATIVAESTGEPPEPLNSNLLNIDSAGRKQPPTATSPPPETGV